MGMKIKIRLAEVVREDGSKEYCCFADEPPLTALEEQIYSEALREIGPLENILGIRGARTFSSPSGRTSRVWSRG
jgi:hypothetical protein